MADDTTQLVDRLDRLEQKIDKLTDAMVTLARTEEKIMALEGDKKTLTERINRHSEKIDELNEEVKNNSRVTSNITKGIWIVVAAVVSIGVRTFFIGG